MNSQKSTARRVDRHLFAGENGYFARMAVPANLRPIVGKRELWSAVRAESDAKAVRKSHAIIAGFNATLDAARAEAKTTRAAPPGRPLTFRQLAEVQYNDRTRADDELRNTDHRYSHGFVDDDYVKRLREIVRGAADNNEMRKTLGVVLRYYEVRGHIKAAEGTPEWRQAARALAVAELESLARTVERDDGDFTGKPSNPLLTEKPQAVPAKADPLAARMLCDDSAKPLSELLPAFLKERNASPHVNFEYHATVRLFEEVCGEPKPVYAITRQDVRAFKDALGETPAYAAKHFKGMTLPEAVKANKARKAPLPTLDSWTIGAKRLSQLRSVLAWCADNEAIPDNPAAAVKINAVRRKDGKLDFSPGDLAKIFAPGRFRKPYGESEWAQLIGLFTGARASEIAQIQLDAIRHQRGCLVLEITGKLKTASSRRLIPIHSSLIVMGFERHVEKLRKGGATHLFPVWYRKGIESKRTAEANGSLTLNHYFPRFIPKQFNRALKEIGIEGRKSFHSLRHTFAAALDLAGAPQSVRFALTGHVDSSVHGGYLHATIEAMHDAIEKLHFDGFALVELATS